MVWWDDSTVLPAAVWVQRAALVGWSPTLTARMSDSGSGMAPGPRPAWPSGSAVPTRPSAAMYQLADSARKSDRPRICWWFHRLSVGGQWPKMAWDRPLRQAAPAVGTPSRNRAPARPGAVC